MCKRCFTSMLMYMYNKSHIQSFHKEKCFSLLYIEEKVMSLSSIPDGLFGSHAKDLTKAFPLCL